MLHELKTEQPYYEDVISGRKSFEIRYNDRDFKEGDYLLLKEILPQNKTYTDRQAIFIVTCIYTYAQRDGYVVMGIKLILEEKQLTPQHLII